MLVKAFILCGNQRMDDIGGYILIFNIAPVALVLIILAHGGAILCIYLCCQHNGRIFQLLEGGQGPKQIQVDHDDENQENSNSEEKQSPENTCCFRHKRLNYY